MVRRGERSGDGGVYYIREPTTMCLYVACCDDRPHVVRLGGRLKATAIYLKAVPFAEATSSWDLVYVCE